MLSAEEARKLQNELNSEEEREQLEKVEQNIKKDIKKGYTYYSGRLKPTVVEELKRLGYSVEFTSDQRDGNFTTIRW